VAVLTLEAIRFQQGDFALTADFSVPAGSRTAIIGPSGGGKSTLLALIAGFETPNSGRITWNGQNLTGQLPGARPIATLFQDGNLFPHLDLETNVALGVEPKARPSIAARDQARLALKKVGLEGFETRMPAALSGGQASRAALARTLLTRRPIVLLDEPFAALGPAMRREMLGLVKTLLPEATILTVTHDPDDARAFGDQTIFVVKGRVASPRQTDAFFADPDPDLQAYLR
jgi:thiamine transport system ATP-binding protein